MPKIVDHEQYRKELLGKCFDLFAQKGYGSITMRQISQGLGVSTGTLYHYFPSKQALFEQLVEEVCQQDLSAALAELGERKTPQEAMEVLGRYIVKNEDYFIKWTYLWVDFCQHQYFPEIPVDNVFKRANQRYHQAVCWIVLPATDFCESGRRCRWPGDRQAVKNGAQAVSVYRTVERGCDHSRTDIVFVLWHRTRSG